MAPVTQALCWAHARRKFFVLADIAANGKRGKDAAPISPIAFEVVKRMDALFEIERDINGLAADQRLNDASRKAGRSQRRLRNGCGPSGQIVPKLRPSTSAHSRLAQQPAKLWLLRAPIVVPIGPPFMGDADQTARLNDVDPQARLADILARVADKSITRLEDLLPLELEPFDDRGG